MLQTESLSQPYVFTDLRQLLIHTNTKVHTDTRYANLREAYIPHIQFCICYSADPPNTFIHTHTKQREGINRQLQRKTFGFAEDGISDEKE